MAPTDEPRHRAIKLLRNAFADWAKERTGDATGFDCETDGKFKVADTVFKEGRVRNYTPAQWEAALYKARQRTKTGEWPVIKSADF